MGGIEKNNNSKKFEKNQKNEIYNEKENTRGCFSEDFCIALDTTQIPIYIIDADNYEMVYSNKTLCDYMKRNPVGEKCYKAICGLDEPCLDCAVTKLIRDGINEATEYYRPSGLCMLVKASPIQWRGKVYYKLSCTDITKQKQLEKQLRLKNKEYCALISQNSTGIILYDIDKEIATLNVDENFNNVDEYTVSQQLINKYEKSIVSEESKDVVRDMFDNIKAGRESQGYDVLLTPKNNTLKWFHLDYTIVEDDDGKPYRAVISFYDNTEQREKELAFQRWNTRMHAIMSEYVSYMEINLSKDVIEAEGRYGTWEKETEGRCFSEALEKMAMTKIYENDRYKFSHFFNREIMLGKYLEGCKEDSLEYRTIFNGVMQWFRAEIQMVRDPNNEDVKLSVLVSNIDEYMREHKRLKREAQRDIMTGLYNHATTEMLIKEIIEQNSEKSCCFFVIDLDDLREINTALGHPEGDKALKAIADCMKSQFGKENIMGRIGGDEFVLFLKDISEIDNLNLAMENFIKQLNAIKIGPNDERSVCASIGGVIGTLGREDFAELYRKADLALFYTKAKGKNGFNFYEPKLEERDFNYKPANNTETESKEAFASSELKKLLDAMSTFYTMMVSANLTKNTYHMMRYEAYTMQKYKEKGTYDRFIEDSISGLHPQDRAEFKKIYMRENILKAYENGERIIRYVGRQLGNDGKYCSIQVIAVLIEDEDTGDICNIIFNHIKE